MGRGARTRVAEAPELTLCPLPSTIVNSGLRRVEPDAFHFTPRLRRL